MIQSSSDIFLDNMTTLTIYFFTPIEAGMNPMKLSTTKCEIIQSSLALWTSRILKMRLVFLNAWCSACSVWKMAEVEYNKIQKVSKIKQANKTLVQKAYEIHTSIGNSINQPITTKEMEL